MFPDGSRCGRYGDPQDAPAVFLEVTMLPGSTSIPEPDEELEMTSELVNIGLGTDTSDASGSPFVVGRLRIEAGGVLNLEVWECRWRCSWGRAKRR